MTEEDHQRAVSARRFLLLSAFQHIVNDADMSQDSWMEWAASSYPFIVGDLGDRELPAIAIMAAEGLRRGRRV